MNCPYSGGAAYPHPPNGSHAHPKRIVDLSTGRMHNAPSRRRIPHPFPSGERKVCRMAVRFPRATD